MMHGVSSLKFTNLNNNRYRVDYSDPDSDRELFGPQLSSLNKEARDDLEENLFRPHATDRCLRFEGSYEGPYERPLAGEYDVLNLYPVSGLCVLCNHEHHKDIDYDIASLPWRQAAKKWNIPYEVLVTHVSRHMGPIYGRIASLYIKNVPPDIAKKVLKKVETSELDALSYRTRIDALTYPHDLGQRLVSSSVTSGLPIPADSDNGGNNIGIVSVPEYGKLRVWEKDRILNEIAIREREAIDYYDEMIVCKKDLERVYDEIMGNSFYTTSKSGEMIESTKPYAAAVSAKREIHSILDSLAKFSVIAARISATPGNESMKLSPEMDSMVSSILGKDYRSRLENLNKSMEVQQDIRMVDAEVVGEIVDE